MQAPEKRSLFRSQSTTPRQGDEAEKASVIHFKDAILPASEEDEDNLADIQEKLKVEALVFIASALIL